MPLSRNRFQAIIVFFLHDVNNDLSQFCWGRWWKKLSTKKSKWFDVHHFFVVVVVVSSPCWILFFWFSSFFSILLQNSQFKFVVWKVSACVIVRMCFSYFCICFWSLSDPFVECKFKVVNKNKSRSHHVQLINVTNTSTHLVLSTYQPKDSNCKTD